MDASKAGRDGIIPFPKSLKSFPLLLSPYRLQSKYKTKCHATGEIAQLKCLLFLKNTWALFPADTSGSSQVLVTSVPGYPTPTVLHRHIHECGIHKLTQAYAQKHAQAHAKCACMCRRISRCVFVCALTRAHVPVCAGEYYVNFTDAKIIR